MQANEFVKEHGIAEAKRVLHDARGCVGVKLWGRYEFSTDDLKRLVESHELVEGFGGPSLARKEAHKNCFSYNQRLLQAIADVESCL